MDFKTTTPATPDPLVAMFQNATIDKAEKNEFSSSARDTIKFAVNNNYFNFTKEGENLVLESSDVIDCLRNVVQPFLENVRKNDHSRSTVGDTASADASGSVPQAIPTDHTVEGDPVEVIDLVPSEMSSLRVASVADRYSRSMLKSLAGYPLYEPQPFSELSTEYLRHGVNVGDVGFVRGDGVFDFLFNVCPTKNGLINPPNLSDGFSLETAEHSATRAARALPRKTCLFQSPTTRTKSGEYVCEGSEGAILELPEGAIQEEATNIRPFEKLAARHGVQWYEYTMARGRKISNGSLYLITSFTKCAQWGIAVFDRPCVPGQGLRFDKKRSLPFGKSTSKYHWKGSPAFPTKISDFNQGDSQNQCVFLRGYKIMIRPDIFDDLCNDQPHGSGPAMLSSSSRAGSISVTRTRATRVRGGGGSDPMSKRLTDGGLLSWTKMSSMTKSDEVVLHANFNSSPVHPSDLINAALLSQNPGAKVSLTHDNVWCDLLRDSFPKLNYATLINIARTYTIIVDEYDRVSLEK
ncbi:hypothetical protein M378DRAFT_732563 [Amanita muscaria Koide BX008]|uniref:Uncharacterized protein n=1 Tax=Amanita muscaria (strain Koide BX008) TaxID=946122 RepID=A0A0C2X2X6_AMAMK|nr:hypothetical protein M378DRAFT_732563 [Amanita muscaria Koide BX008]